MSADSPAPHLVCSATAPSAEAVRFDPAWRTSTVLAIAQGIVRDGNFDAMPILADALEDAGCDNPIILGHCRCGIDHFQSCWVCPFILSGSTPPVQKPPSVFVEAGRIFGEPNQSVLDHLILPSSLARRRRRGGLLWFWSVLLGGLFALSLGHALEPILAWTSCPFTWIMVILFGSVFGVPSLIFVIVCALVAVRRWRKRNSTPPH